MGCDMSSLLGQPMRRLLTGNPPVVKMDDESVAFESEAVPVEESQNQTGIAGLSPVPVSPIHGVKLIEAPPEDQLDRMPHETAGGPSQAPVTAEKLWQEHQNDKEVSSSPNVVPIDDPIVDTSEDPTTIEKAAPKKHKVTEEAAISKKIQDPTNTRRSSTKLNERRSSTDKSSPERREEGANKINRENDFRTPSKAKHMRRRIDGSPILPACSKPRKTVYIFRHGFSQGQAAQKNGLDRKTDPSLRDCALTKRGIEEARAIPEQFSDDERDSIEVVFSSPLTRALHTSVLSFPDKDIVCHFDLGEIGTKAPENVPRKMAMVLKDLHEDIEKRSSNVIIDTTTYQPSDWPRDTSPGVIKKEKVKKFFQWLYKEREESVIAVVCHHNVIKAVVINGEKLRPKNAQLISCSLNSNGELFVLNELETNDGSTI